MMKKALSFTAAFVLLVCSIICPLTAYAENYHKSGNINPEKSGLVDEKQLFTEDDYKELDKLIKEEAQKLDMNIVVYLSGYARSDMQTEIFADDTYDEMYGEDTDGVFYYLDTSEKIPLYDYISTSGKGVLFYQQNIDNIFYALDAYLPRSGEPVIAEDIYSAIEAFLYQLERYSDTKQPYFRYYHDVSSGKYFYYKNGELVISRTKPLRLYAKPFLISSVIGFIIALIVYSCTKHSYKFMSGTNAKVYVSQNRTHFSQRSDLFIREHTTRTKIESSSGGGGRSGGGHSGGGGHGGGGHHR